LILHYIRLKACHYTNASLTCCDICDWRGAHTL